MRIRIHGWKQWLLVALVLIAVFLFVAQDQDVLRVQSPVAVSDSRFADYAASLVGAPVQSGDSYAMLLNGDAFPPMLEAIRQARSRISFESFIYEDGDVGDRFTEALVDAARRGVTVRLVLDSFGANLSRKSQDAIRDAGASIVWFNPFRPWTIEETNYRTHRKVLVVDGRVAFTGGMGLADHWAGNAEDKDHWRDTQFQVWGPTVRALEASFYENWLESGGGTVPALDPEDPPQGTGARSIVVWSNPTGGASNVKLLYLISLASARTSIDIQSPYFILDESTRWVLDEARRRGVRIRILTEGEITDAPPVKFASRDAYEGLLEGGYEIYEYVPTMMHVKATIIDGTWSIIGSANFDNRSFELNDELTIAVSDAVLGSTLTRAFEADVSRSKRLTLQEWQRRSLLQRSREWFWSWFGEVF